MASVSPKPHRCYTPPILGELPFTTTLYKIIAKRHEQEPSDTNGNQGQPKNLKDVKQRDWNLTKKALYNTQYKETQ
ncbi:hypothetical protein MBO12_00600 [Candidatus Saccharibacteria bacterium]|nr:hypothetical protein [Candidatus Saccharibacteria bacterium]